MPESENAAGVSAPTQVVTVAGDVQYAYRRFGTGPRHMAFSKDGKYVYVVGEMKATVTVLRYDAKTGGGEAIQTISMLPPPNANAAQLKEGPVRAHVRRRVHPALHRGGFRVAAGIHRPRDPAY